MTSAMILATLATVAVATAPPAPVPPSQTGYPTEALADYVIGCMAANGQTQDSLRRCSCSIDTIAAVLPYDDYVKAQTVIAMRGQGGERAALFTDVPQLRAMAQKLRAAQVEADFRCF
jgi:hypothetical protein